MSVKDTLKKKVAPIAVAAATLLTPVATQGAEKPEAEQNPQKMEQIQENKIHKKKKLRDESIDKLAKTKDLTDDDIRVMRMANEDAEKIEVSLEKMKALLKSQGIDDAELASFDDIHIATFKTGPVVIECTTDDSPYTSENEFNKKVFVFDGSGKLITNDYEKLDEATRRAISQENIKDSVTFSKNGDLYYNESTSEKYRTRRVSGQYSNDSWAEPMFNLKYNAKDYSDFEIGRKGETTTTVTVREKDVSPDLHRNEGLPDANYSIAEDKKLTKEKNLSQSAVAKIKANQQR